ncbi:hypothetical protein [Novosphingobium sp. FKTRR1]|uniref:hypothetical protein n=1 Tax=Novosphingobium sp. FKTRR1 TaxID=2879118 RepID=UPI001CEFBFF3|nr:hypothetical protein [Novosphingobium sp. FKTRR1]
MVGWRMIVTVRFGDPDDALRLVEVRDWLAGQSWFDVHQYRIAAPAGVAMHWSRLVDLPIAGLIVLLRPLLGGPLAEHVTLVAVPLLTLLCAVLLVARLAARRFDAETAGIACLVLGINSLVLFQMSPLRIDHHGWQIVFALTALSGLFADSERRGGALIGLSLAALLTISIEGLPLTAGFLGVLALRGLRRPSAQAQTRFAGLATAAVTLALASGALFLGTRGTTDLITHCDQLSPVHLALFCWTALGLAALHSVAPRTPLAAIIVLGVTGLGALAIMLGAAPQCKGGAFVALDPLVQHYWYIRVAEGMPFWRSPAMIAANTVGVPLVGLFACFDHWRRSRDAASAEAWIDHGLILLVAWVIGMTVARASATACAFAAVPTAGLMLRWIVALRSVSLRRQVSGYLGLAVALLPGLPVAMWNTGYGQILHHEPIVRKLSVALRQSQCRFPLAAQALDTLSPTDILAPLDIGPDLLVRSRHRVVATGHHRGSAGMHDVIAAFLGSPDQARPIIAARHVSLIVVCPDIAEPAAYSHYAPDGLMARLLQGRGPAWLQPVDLAPGSHMRFWRVVDPAPQERDKAI